MHPNIATKDMSPFRKHTKDLRARTKDAQQINWNEVESLPSIAHNAAIRATGIVEADRSNLKTEPATAHAVERKDVGELDDEELASYARDVALELKHAREYSMLKRVRAENAEKDRALIERSLDAICEADAALRAFYDERARAVMGTYEEYEKLIDGLAEQLEEAREEIMRRQPQSLSAMSRELDDMRRELDRLKQ